jgi:hypothetical protein
MVCRKKDRTKTIKYEVEIKVEEKEELHETTCLERYNSENEDSNHNHT